ncbi:hypothetical protein P2L35_13315 [Enterococcus faecium]|nr:hypothetical protein [Enterococcus faecium]
MGISAISISTAPTEFGNLLLTDFTSPAAKLTAVVAPYTEPSLTVNVVPPAYSMPLRQTWALLARPESGSDTS